MLVRESIAFQRYKDPKTALFGWRPGTLIIFETFKEKTNVYMYIEEFFEEDIYKNLPDVIRVTRLGYLMFDEFTIYDDFITMQYSSGKPKRKLTPDELELVQKAFDDNPKKKELRLKRIKRYAKILPYEIS